MIRDFARSPALRLAGMLVLAVALAVNARLHLAAQEAAPVVVPAEAAGETAAAPAPAEPAGEGLIPTKSLAQIFRDGGLLMYPIALCSFLLLVFVFERFIFLRRGRVIPGPFVKKFLEQLREGQIDRDKALALCEENRSPVAVVFAAAVKKWGRAAVEVEQAIIDSGERVNNDLRKHLRVLNGVAQVGPLLGLLGTVLGMISSFNGLAAAGASGQREMLAAGIAEALITTAAGMVVAIPALISYLYFVGRIDRLIMDLDALGQQVVEAISADALDRQEGRSSRKKAA